MTPADDGDYVLFDDIGSLAAPMPPMSDDVRAIFAELDRAMKKFPTWPTDPLHAVAVLGEEFGELTKAVLQSVYEPHKSTHEDVCSEAIQTAAMAIRFVASLRAYQFQRCEQHSQNALESFRSRLAAEDA